MTTLQKIEQTALALLKANNTVTTLEIKNELRKKYPNERWNQNLIHDTMDYLYSSSNKYMYTYNGVYRIYSLLNTAKPVASITKKSNNKKISKTKALELIQKTSGKFFGVTFTKKNGEIRKMRCKVQTGSLPDSLGYLKVTDTVDSIQKSLNLQTISELRMNKNTYKVS